MILTYDVGKRRLWLGQPFLIRTALEPTPEEVLELGASNVAVLEGSFIVGAEPTSAAYFRRILPESSADWVLATPLEGDLPPSIVATETLDLGPGVYDVRIARGATLITVAEPIWILDRADYIALARDSVAEEFQIGPIVSAPSEFKSMFKGTISDRWPRCPAKFEVSYVATIQSPIHPSPGPSQMCLMLSGILARSGSVI